MAGLGFLVNVASAGIGLLSSFLGGSSSLSDPEYHLELEDGKRLCLLARYVAFSENSSIVGKDYPIERPSVRSSKGLTDGPLGDDAAVQFTTGVDDSGDQLTYAVNTSTTLDYWLFWARTDIVGNSFNNQTFLARATNKYKPTLVDITGLFGDYGNGNFAVTAAQIYPSPYVMEILKFFNPAPTVEPDTLLGNFGVSSVFAQATYFLYTSTSSGNVQWSWVTTSSTDPTSTDNSIIGAKVTSTVDVDVNISGTLTWANPTNAFTVNFTANNINTNGGITVFDFPPSNRPLVAASISAIQPASTAEEAKKLLALFLREELAKGKTKRIKYLIV